MRAALFWGGKERQRGTQACSHRAGLNRLGGQQVQMGHIWEAVTL